MSPVWEQSFKIRFVLFLAKKRKNSGIGEKLLLPRYTPTKIGEGKGWGVLVFVFLLLYHSESRDRS